MRTVTKAVVGRAGWTRHGVSREAAVLKGLKRGEREWVTLIKEELKSGTHCSDFFLSLFLYRVDYFFSPCGGRGIDSIID